MTRDSQLPGGDEPDLEDDERDAREPQGTLRTTGPGLLTGLFLAGLVLGRMIKPLVLSMDGIAPRVGWPAVLALFLAAAIMGYVAFATQRTLHRRGERLEAHQAVNRLVLAKACALAGAFFTGGYLGYALSWLGDDAELGHERLAQSLLAGLACALVVVASLALERACRIRGPRGKP